MNLNIFLFLFAIFSKPYSCFATKRRRFAGFRASRIFNGTEPPKGSHPHVLYILIRTKTCTGSLITPKTALSAAHCFYVVVKNARIKVSDDEITVIAGIHTINGPEPSRQERKSSRIAIPKGYDPQTSLKKDIALVIVNQPFRIDPNFVDVIPVSSLQPKVGSICSVHGFGRLDFEKRTPVLKMGYQRILSQSECSAKAAVVLQGHQICTYSPTTTLMRGDSGCGLVCGQHGIFQVVGVLSRGNFTHKISVFTNCYMNKPWIFQNMS